MSVFQSWLPKIFCSFVIWDLCLTAPPLLPDVLSLLMICALPLPPTASVSVSVSLDIWALSGMEHSPALAHVGQSVKLNFPCLACFRWDGRDEELCLPLQPSVGGRQPGCCVIWALRLPSSVKLQCWGVTQFPIHFLIDPLVLKIFLKLCTSVCLCTGVHLWMPVPTQTRKGHWTP